MTPLDTLSVPLRGTTLIEASAGTGKTYTIATLFVRLLLERGLRVDQILVVTYTRAAASELRDRIRRTLAGTLAAIDGAESALKTDEPLSALVSARAQSRDPDRHALQNALRDFDEAAISTMHAFCQRVLTECAFESRSAFELTLLEDDRPLIHETTLDYFARAGFALPPAFASALDRDALDEKHLLRLALEVLRTPDMPVLPESPEALEVSRQPFEAARARAAALWKANRDRLLRELTVPNRLHGTYFKPDVIREEWVPLLDSLESVEEPRKWFAYLTPAGLRANKGQRPPTHPFFDAMAELVSAQAAIQAALDAGVIRLQRELVDYVRREVVARHERLAVQSFDDLLRNLHAALQGERGELVAHRMAKRFGAALIDEFQDTDPVQYSILARLYRGQEHALFLVGDPKQAIYRFRGADVFAYLKAARNRDTECTLAVSQRSDPGLVQALNTLYRRAARPFLLEAIAFEPLAPKATAQNRLTSGEPALQILFVARPEPDKKASKKWAKKNLHGLIAGEISRLLHDHDEWIDAEDEASGRRVRRRLEPRDIAVLCRTNDEAKRTQSALAELGIPTVLDGDSSVFQSETAEHLRRVLSAVAQPNDVRGLGSALATPLFGLDARALHALRGEDDGLEPWLERFARYHQVWHERGFMQMLERLLDDEATSVYSQLLRRPDGERRLTDLLHLGELLHRAALEQHLGPLALLHWFDEMRHDAEEGGSMAPESAQVRLEHDDRALRLTTVHRSKGLEYPIVYCPFLWGGLREEGLVAFHDPEDGERVKLDLGSSELDRHREIARREELAENLRLLYVALTRARHRCYVVWGNFHQGEDSSLAYLLHHAPHDRLGASLESLCKGFGKKTDAALREELELLCEASEGVIGCRDLMAKDAPRYEAKERTASGELKARIAKRRLRLLPRMSSFSRLAAHAEAPPSAAALEGFDHDEEGVEPSEQVVPEAEVVLNDFPAGARAGSLVHAVYEHIDFTRSDPSELPREVERLTRAFGYAPDTLKDVLVAGIDATLRTPLDPVSRLTLGAVKRRDRLDELEFTLSAGRAADVLSTEALAGVFERFEATASVPAYHERVRELQVVPPSGFLKGFVDLVFRHEGRYFIVDYKSNHLGPSASHYQAAALAKAMVEHHYVLQYHLYTVALHRHLRRCQPDYGYEKHFGGVYYLFVRGMAPEHAPGTGLFFDRPSLALIEALAGVLGCQPEGA